MSIDSGLSREISSSEILLFLLRSSDFRSAYVIIAFTLAVCSDNILSHHVSNNIKCIRSL